MYKGQDLFLIRNVKDKILEEFIAQTDALDREQTEAVAERLVCDLKASCPDGLWRAINGYEHANEGAL